MILHSMKQVAASVVSLLSCWAAQQGNLCTADASIFLRHIQSPVYGGQEENPAGTMLSMTDD